MSVYVYVCVCVCVYVCVCVLWSGTAATLYAYNDWVEEFRLRKKMISPTRGWSFYNKTELKFIKLLSQ